ncbi:glycosyltransferase family 2 protein [Patescibacteria group bacterium]
MKIDVQKPVFSVITPTFNRAYVLWKAIQSVLGQTFPYFELIIVDDGSDDDTEKMVKQFSDPRVKYFKLLENSGASAARNYGLNKANGDYVAYLDSDNFWYPEYLEVMMDAFKKFNDKILVFCRKNYRLTLVEDGKEKRLRDEFTSHRKFFDLKRLWHRRILIDTNTMCHRRKEVLDLGGWDEDLGFWEDWELTLRISEKYPTGFLYLNRTMLDYEQKIDVTKAEEIFNFWEKEEAKIFKKYKGNPLLEGQGWFPPEKDNKSTLGVVDYLKKKYQK